MLKSDFSPKAVSKLMDHAKELITVDVYGDNQNIIPEEMSELLSYMDDVMPKKKDGDKQGDDALDAGINVEEYLLGLDGCDHNCKNKYSEQMF